MFNTYRTQSRENNYYARPEALALNLYCDAIRTKVWHHSGRADTYGPARPDTFL